LLGYKENLITKHTKQCKTSKRIVWRLHNRVPPEAAGWQASPNQKTSFAGFESFVTKQQLND
jgi:hypothetical protein